jgi:hypothetical protein
LLKSAAPVWGMDTFNEYLKGKKFILYTDHKPLEKMGHLHTKTMNRLQFAFLEHDFIIQYKKGMIMPADYLSRLPSTNKNQLAEVTQCFDPFQPELIDSQKTDPDLQKMNHFRTKGEWPSYVTKATIYKTSQSNFSKMPTKLSGSGLMTINIQEQHYTFLKIFGKWHYVRLTITNSVIVMLP